MKNILISQHVACEEKYGSMDTLQHNYMTYFESFSFHLIPVPNAARSLSAYLKNSNIHGIILSGGNNISSELYGEKTRCEDTSKERDHTEGKLLDYAKKNRVPVLGICRGMQFINVFFGGKLCQDLRHVSKNNLKHAGNVHDISLFSSEAIRYFSKVRLKVNSFHEQGVLHSTLSTELKTFAISPRDGIIEGIYHPHLPIAGIQWHPERKSPDAKSNARIIKAFSQRKLFWEKM